jgi:hypothetical protein
MSNTSNGARGDGLPPGPNADLAEALGQLNKQYGTAAVQAQMDAASATNDMNKVEPSVAGLTATEVVPGSTGPKLRPDGSVMTPAEAMAQAAGEQQQKALAEQGYPLWQQTTAQKPS